MSAIADVVAKALRAVEVELAGVEERELELTEAESWARDPAAWIEAHAWIASKFAGRPGRVAPVRMRLYPDQRLTIARWVDLERLEASGELVWRNLVIEKSRQIGETWLFAAVIAWALHYHPVVGMTMHVRAAEIADRGLTPKSLFGKIRYIDARLPETMPGRGRLRFDPFSTDPAKITNERNGAVVYGECQRDDPGRGGTFEFVLIDEAAFVQHGELVYSAIDEACPEGKALLSTVNGSDNFHARLADERPEGFEYLRLHWSTHPVYSAGVHVAGVLPERQPSDAMAEAAAGCRLCEGTRDGVVWASRGPRSHRFAGRLTSPWYDRAVIGKTAQQVARELDIDREGSISGRVYDEFESSVHVHRDAAGREAPIRYDPAIPLELGFDYGLDCSSVVVCQDAPDSYRVIGEVELVDRPGETPTPDEVARALRVELEALGVPARLLEPEWTRRIYARGDPSGDARNLDTGRSTASAYRREGFNVTAPPAILTRRVDDSITAVKLLCNGVPKPLRVSSRCVRFVRHMTHNRWPTDATGARRPGSTRPLDDEHNHMARAFAYLVVSKFPPGPSGSSGARDGDPWGDEGGSARSRYGSLVDVRPLAYDAPL